MLMLSVVCEPKKMAHILHHWFPHEMMSEKPMQKFHTNYVMTSLPRLICVMLLIGHTAKEICLNQSEAQTRSG